MGDHEFSLFGRNLKCFGTKAEGFAALKRVNLIIGRNNSGKSSLLELVHQATLPKVSIPSNHWHGGQSSEVFAETTVAEKDILVFPASTSGGPIRGNHYEFGKQYIGARITVRLIADGRHEYVSLRPPDNETKTYVDLTSTPYSKALANTGNRNLLAGKQFWRLAAERDVVPEADAPNPTVQSEGRGATNLIQNFINKSHLPSSVVEVDLLAALNSVFNPDARFEQILCQQHSTNLWEIYLEEACKGRIALSQSGSGLKTIILALTFVHLLPRLLAKSLHEFVFAFEELENNLHPALQRRLLTYLAEQARTHDFSIFLTTHSSVAIDLFNKQSDAQIVHVTHDGKVGTCRLVQAYIDNHGILDDLDVRASDLLQANGIIWVEGPSDRIYLNRWIALWSHGELSEGNQYQCVFYGGRLLAHLSGQAPDIGGDGDGDLGVSILRVNRNAAVLIDSDKRRATDPINRTKKRILSEVEELGGLVWVTEGREIENYNPQSVISKWLPGLGPIPQDDLESLFVSLDRLKPGVGTEFVDKKPLLAEQLTSLTERADLESVPRLSEKLDLLCTRIRSWNNL